MDILIRQELTEEYNTTEEVIKKAFLNEEYSDKKEHLLVNRIRKSDAFIPELSLVAIDQDDEIVGHILLSKITIVDDDKAVDSLALAPVAVVPEHQKKGIGSQLIHTALKKAKEVGHHSVIVLGHKDYYPKFGFKQASLWNIQAPFEVPDEVFMALELTENSLESVQGVVYYSKAFSE
ncbi:GCN5 family acetyltransferase [Aneurinibacillus migulanus]|uniref:GCN5 family acetyltransferase n=1 Tax=Aneurinibacillus migulanus TaxID=47500 RepID=A0A0D1Y9T2_ANEMI|nr:N-acetyltransferase [Aneurinibacillus migulanus]KIV53252.1 GCN5 family acetyltransferase [Aneurinibacillus migulanus]KIV55882.1 GCN5 family acetyltransferase [Aneurinibacillus migulanus]KON97425.1 GCN5 family acetyltransferase [Aneurinibacillus migulanus]KPD04764.1 GCN5 family acetyltransferase [Aneurinibacillus migulanus]MED0895970.1 N-acetyltransferase [Aneurinibacillus migulanus]